MQHEWEASQSENPTDFTSIPIEPSILHHEQQFQLQQAPLSQVVIQVDEEEEEEEEEEKEEEEGSDIETLSRSVASLDSIAQNADFRVLEFGRQWTLVVHNFKPVCSIKKLSLRGPLS